MVYMLGITNEKYWIRCFELYKNKIDRKKKCHEYYLNHKEEILKRSRKRYLKKRDDLQNMHMT